MKGRARVRTRAWVEVKARARPAEGSAEARKGAVIVSDVVAALAERRDAPEACKREAGKLGNFLTL